MMFKNLQKIFKGGKKVQWLSKSMIFAYALIILSVSFNLLGYDSTDVLGDVYAAQWETWKIAVVGVITAILRQVTTGPLSSNAVQRIIFWLLELLGLDMTEDRERIAESNEEEKVA